MCGESITLESLTEDNAELIKTPIKRFTPTGIETIDGKTHDFDAIFCATGANTDLVPPFPKKARGVDLNKAWKPDGKFGFPYTYMGTATPGFPNLFFLAGPHATGPSGTVPHAIEIALTYQAKVLRKVSTQGIKSIAPLVRESTVCGLALLPGLRLSDEILAGKTGNTNASTNKIGLLILATDTPKERLTRMLI